LVAEAYWPRREVGIPLYVGRSVDDWAQRRCGHGKVGGVATVYYTATTMDGYIADDANCLGWLFEVPPEKPFDETFGAFFSGIGAMAMGATTYEWVVDHDRLIENPDAWHRFYGKTPCWVFTHRDLPGVPGANITFVQGGVGPVHGAMQRVAGDRNVWLVGGGELVGQFADRGLLDEIVLSVAPVTLGVGAPLLPRRLRASDLELVDVARDGQFARLSYRVRR
jgi:dihydrofolate reductase